MGKMIGILVLPISWLSPSIIAVLSQPLVRLSACRPARAGTGDFSLYPQYLAQDWHMEGPPVFE